MLDLALVDYFRNCCSCCVAEGAIGVCPIGLKGTCQTCLEGGTGARMPISIFRNGDEALLAPRLDILYRLTNCSLPLLESPRPFERLPYHLSGRSSNRLWTTYDHLFLKLSSCAVTAPMLRT